MSGLGADVLTALMVGARARHAPLRLSHSEHSQSHTQMSIWRRGFSILFHAHAWSGYEDSLLLAGLTGITVLRTGVSPCQWSLYRTYDVFDRDALLRGCSYSHDNTPGIGPH